MDDSGTAGAESGQGATRALTVVVPSYNEADNVAPLVGRLNRALRDIDAEVLYVDDSTDDTPTVVRACAAVSALPVSVLHRTTPAGGLAGAVAAGIAAARGDYVVVMDADLQHPPELVPDLVAEAVSGDLDLVVASRYVGQGDAAGLASAWRRTVSGGSTVLARATFPRRVGRVCTDPMTGFFCVRRSALDLSRLRPRGFKILLEILARHDLAVGEIPFQFAERHSGLSKASWRTGLHFLRQLGSLRMGRFSRFAVVGALGTVVNLAVMWLAMHVLGANYLVASVAATELSILHNFALQERLVFTDHVVGVRASLVRLVQSVAFNNVEAALRLPFLVLLVSGLGMYAVVVQGITLAASFVLRFAFHSKVVYRGRRPQQPALTPATQPLPAGSTA